MSNVERFIRPPEPEAEDPRTAAMVTAILSLVDGLSVSERESVLKEITRRLRPISVPRAGDVLSTVVQLLPRDREWTVKEIKSRVEMSGAEINDKELYNAIGYLTRKQRIHRIGVGRYVIDGVLVVTGDELGGQPSITEGDLDD